MDLESKAKIICQFYGEYKDDTSFSNLFKIYEPGILLARQNYCGETLHDEQVAVIEKLSLEECAEWISSTWTNLCLNLGNKDPRGAYKNLNELIESPRSENTSEFLATLETVSGTITSRQEAFRRGQLIEASEAEIRKQIADFIENGENLSESHRFFIYGLLSSLQDKLTFVAILVDELKQKSISNSDEEDRLNLVNFLLHYSAGVLSTQKLFPLSFKDVMQKVDSGNPLVRQNPAGSWEIDLVRLGVSPEFADQSNEVIEDAKKFLFGDISSFDHGFISECCQTELVQSDLSDLTYRNEFLESTDFVDFAVFVWSDYWYPKFLLLAYANPANVFVEPFDAEIMTQWCNSYDDEIGVAPLLPSGMVEIFRFTPRILALMSTKLISEHFEEIPDNFINLFLVLKHARPEADPSARDEVIRDYIESAQIEDSEENLDHYLNVDSDMQKFFEIVAASLYTKNHELLSELSLMNDNVTRMCVLLNPATPVQVINQMGHVDFTLLEEIEFDTSYSDDNKFSDSETFAEFIAGVAANCHDFEFADSVKLRLNETKLQPEKAEESENSEGQKTLVLPNINKPSISIETMAKLVAEFTELENSNEAYREFFEYNDLGVPLAYAFNLNQIVFTDAGKKVIHETYVEMCKLLKADPNKEYDSLDELAGSGT